MVDIQFVSPDYKQSGQDSHTPLTWSYTRSAPLALVPLSANEALILAMAGDGSKTDGFRNLLCLYRELHNVGYRCSMDLAAFMLEFNNAKAREIN
jgi:hypothetical protein